MRNKITNKLYEDFFDDIDKDEIVNSEVEDSEDDNGYKEYSHSFGIDCPIINQRITPVQLRPLLQLLSYIDVSNIFKRYCLKIELCSSRYQICKSDNTILKTFEFNPDSEITAKKFANDFVDYITKTNKECVAHYHFTFDINTSLPFYKFVIFYINVSQLLSCVTRNQTFNKPLWQFHYEIIGTIVDDKYRIFKENTWETMWDLTNTSKYCEVIDTLYKMFTTYGCSATVSQKDIDKIKQKWSFTYEIDYYLLLSHFELINPFEKYNIKVDDFGHSGNYNYISLDHKNLPEDANEPFNGTMRFVPFKISQIDSLLSSVKERYSKLSWTLSTGYNTILNAIIDMIPNYDENSMKGYNLYFSGISNSLISGLTEEQFIHYCENLADEETKIHIDDIVDFPVGETREYKIEDWKPSNYDVYDNPNTGKKFSIKVTKSRKKNVLFSKLTLKRLK